MTKAKPAKPIRMTALWVENYKKPGLSPSDTESGLRLYVSANLRKSWVHFYRHPVSKKLIKRTMPFTSLAAARKLIADGKYLHAQGVDPIDHARSLKEAEVAKSEGTLNAVAKRYLDLCASKLRSRAYYEAALKRYILPSLGARHIAQIKRTEITAALDRVEQRSGPSAAGAAQRVLSAVMNWHQGRSEFTSPMTRMKARVKALDSVRTHVPTDDEIKRIWIAAGDERVGPYGQAIRLLILSGARKREASGLRRSEIETMRDNGAEYTVWRLPASRSKNKCEIVRPLSRAAVELVESAPQIGDSNVVFTLDGIRPVNMGQAKKRLLDELSGVRTWIVHDLRRVHRSLLSRTRTPFETAERLLGHSQSLLVRTYDQHSHLGAMLEAVEKVASEIARIVAGERKGKVVRLR
jgi:integrase